ncbi:MAG: CCA tRNA nucleotidyltransferase [Bdellovibrionales bacterium]|nr:CCA tRNA nucleotidyltransferase [Bdellovibrionales bacterium]
MSFEQTLKNRIIRFLEGRNEIAAIKSAAAEARVSVYITGGALRDLALEDSVSADLDLLIEGTPVERETFKIALSEEVRRLQIPQGALRVDALETEDAERFVTRFDFTVNSLLYDLQEESLADPCGQALKDLETRTLRTPSVPTFVIHILPFVKTFRLASKLNLSLHPSTKDLIRDFGPMIHSLGPEGEVLALGELLSFLTLPTIASQLREMSKIGFLHVLLPELCALVQDQDVFPEALSSLDFLESTVPRSSEPVRESVLRIHALSVPLTKSLFTHKEKFTAYYSRLALVRLCILLYWNSLAFSKLPRPEGPEEKEELIAAFDTNPVKGIMARLSQSNELRKVYSTLGTMLPHIRKIVSQIEMDGSPLSEAQFSQYDTAEVIAAVGLTKSSAFKIERF